MTRDTLHRLSYSLLSHKPAALTLLGIALSSALGFWLLQTATRLALIQESNVDQNGDLVHPHFYFVVPTYTLAVGTVAMLMPLLWLFVFGKLHDKRMIVAGITALIPTGSMLYVCHTTLVQIGECFNYDICPVDLRPALVYGQTAMELYGVAALACLCVSIGSLFRVERAQ